jgi:Holliday junction resolvase-like predicted endonuclease
MCMSCGCMQPDDNHGDERNITREDLDRAARAANIWPEQAAQDIMTCCRIDQLRQQPRMPQQPTRESSTGQLDIEREAARVCATSVSCVRRSSGKEAGNEEI